MLGGGGDLGGRRLLMVQEAEPGHQGQEELT